jgi:acyl-CoA thioesterase-2
MPDVLRELVDLLALEQVSDHVFRGRSQDLGWGLVYGGQVLGQALSAAERTVPGGRACHSLHAYFLRPGDVASPITYAVDRIRDGGSFATRRVVATQRDLAIFSMSASFQADEPGLEFRVPAPPAPPAEGLVDQVTLGRAIADELPPFARPMATMEAPIEIRPVDPEHPTALRPLGMSGIDGRLELASLDHAMWFHRPFRMDDWLLYDMAAQSTSGGRGLVHGRIFDRVGVLVASTMQEGLMRLRAP